MIYCPKCGNKAESMKTRYGIRNHCCDLWSWGNAPLVDKNTHKSRMAAHESFDRLWKSGLMKRSDAYAWLAKSLSMPLSDCHMKKMKADVAKEVVQLCRNFNQLTGTR